MTIERSEAETLGLITRNYDAVPRDGPAVFVTTTDAVDSQDTPEGAWIDAGAEQEQIASGIEAVSGQAWRLGGWAIIDQIGLGPVAVDEDCPPRELGRLAGRVASSEATT